MTRDFTLGQAKAFTSGCGRASPDVSMTMWSGGDVAPEHLLHRRQEIVGDGAADAAVGELDDVVRAAGLAAAIGKHLTVEADIAEFVDDQRDAPPARILQEPADQRRLPGAEEAGDDRCGNAVGGAHGDPFR